jgi:hypothetical protein
MGRITIPKIAALNGGALYEFVDDLTNVNSAVERTPIAGNLIIDDTKAPADQIVPMDQSTLLSILAQGGEVEEILMAIKQPNSFANVDVPDVLPWTRDALGNARTFARWFLDGAKVWTSSGFFVYYTNPAAALAQPYQYLKGSQMEVIRQLDPVNIQILSLDEAAQEVATGYTKVVW